MMLQPTFPGSSQSLDDVNRVLSRLQTTTCAGGERVRHFYWRWGEPDPSSLVATIRRQAKCQPQCPIQHPFGSDPIFSATVAGRHIAAMLVPDTEGPCGSRQ